jgi:hypothetical protein
MHVPGTGNSWEFYDVEAYRRASEAANAQTAYTRGFVLPV